MPQTFDVVVVGGGFGGYVAAIRAAQLGLSVALVEQDKVGGTCLHRGCIPTKALLQTASLLDQLASAQEFGVKVGPPSLDYSVMATRRDRITESLWHGVEFLLKKNRVGVFPGHGHLADANTVLVTPNAGGAEEQLLAGAIILATGSSVKVPTGITTDPLQICTSDEALKRPYLPGSVIVLGAGAVGVEFASFYRSVGAEVTLVEMMDRLVPLEDGDVSAELRARFEARGIKVMTATQADLGSLAKTAGGKVVQLPVTGPDGGGDATLTAEMLLFAIGRSTNLDGIGLETVGLTPQTGALAVDEFQRTNVQSIYAVGDITGGFQLAHRASHQGIVAAEAIAGQNPHPVLNKNVPRTTYCSPQIASIGLSEEEAKATNTDIRVGTFPFKANGRALIWGEPDGFCKVVSASDGEILGVHLIGHEVTELIEIPALGSLLESTTYELGHTIAPHPTLSEVLIEAALAAEGKAIHI